MPRRARAGGCGRRAATDTRRTTHHDAVAHRAHEPVCHQDAKGPAFRERGARVEKETRAPARQRVLGPSPRTRRPCPFRIISALSFLAPRVDPEALQRCSAATLQRCRSAARPRMSSIPAPEAPDLPWHPARQSDAEADCPPSPRRRRCGGHSCPDPLFPPAGAFLCPALLRALTAHRRWRS